MSDIPRLSRSLPNTPTAPPVRMVHLGIGNFHRAHQAWYTAHAPDAEQWGIAGFTGRRADMAEALTPQNWALHPDHTQHRRRRLRELVGTVSAVHGAAEHDAYLDYLSRPEVAILTITVTEAGYLVAIKQSTKR